MSEDEKYYPVVITKKIFEKERDFVEGVNVVSDICDALGHDRGEDALEFIRRHFGINKTVTYNKSRNTVTLFFTEDEVRDFMSYALAGDEVVTGEKIEKAVMHSLLSELQSHQEKNANKIGFKDSLEPVKYAEYFLNRVRSSVQERQKSRWYENYAVMCFGGTFLFVLPLVAVFGSFKFKIDADGEPYGFVYGILTIAAMAVGCGLVVLCYQGLESIRSQWMKQKEVLRDLNRRYNLKEKLFERIEEAAAAETADSEAEHAYEVLAFLNTEKTYDNY